MYSEKNPNKQTQIALLDNDRLDRQTQERPEWWNQTYSGATMQKQNWL